VTGQSWHMTVSWKLPAHVLREVAVAAETDPRTVVRYVIGARVKGLCAKRIERTLRVRGLAHLIPQPAKSGE